jgi:hypothetical protein
MDPGAAQGEPADWSAWRRGLIAGALEVTMTRPRIGALGWIVLLVLPASATAAELSPGCRTTLAPSRLFAEPSPSSASRFWYGSEALAVLLRRSGTWQGMGPSHNYRDKLFWWRQGYDGTTAPRPELVVSGRRIDGEAPPVIVSRATNAYHEDFGGWAMLVGIEFPASGCWEMTGRYEGQAVTFVVRVGP